MSGVRLYAYTNELYNLVHLVWAKAQRRNTKRVILFTIIVLPPLRVAPLLGDKAINATKWAFSFIDIYRRWRRVGPDDDGGGNSAALACLIA